MKLRIGGLVLSMSATSALASPQAEVAGVDVGALQPTAEVSARMASVLRPFDADGSGLIDDRGELVEVPCAVWTRIDDELMRSHVLGVWGWYVATEQDGLSLDALGIDPNLKPQVWHQASECGLADVRTGALTRAEIAAAAIARVHDVAGPSDPVAVEGMVAGLLVQEFDGDGDGMVGASELTGVPCGMWRVADRMMATTWGAGLYDAYGLELERDFLGERLQVEPGAREAMRAALLTCGVGPEVLGVPNVRKGTLAGRIRETDASGTSLWETGIKGLLLEQVDLDGSRAIDTTAELQSIGCDAWQALDEAVRDGRPRGLYGVYGLDPDRPYRGEVLGIAADVRAEAAQRAVRCGVRPTSWLSTLPEHEGASTPEPMVDLADAISRVPDPGSRTWLGAIRRMLLDSSDLDASGLLDGGDELRMVGCDAWVALDQALWDQVDTGLIAGFGVAPGEKWTGYALGVDGSVQAIAADVLQGCGLQREAPSSQGESGRSESVVRDIWQIDGHPGTAAFDQGLSAVMLRHFDLDRSGALDRGREVAAVPCRVWIELELSSLEGYGLSVDQVYGLDRRGNFVEGSIGLSPKTRKSALTAVNRCRAEEARAAAER